MSVGATSPEDKAPLADYHSIIAAGIARLPNDTAQSRRGVYDFARQVVRARLGQIEPPLASIAVVREELALERAIQSIEARYLGKVTESGPPPEPAAVEQAQSGPLALLASLARAPVHHGRERVQAQQVQGIVLRTLGLSAALAVGLFGYWLAVGRPGVNATRSLSRMPPVQQTPVVQADGGAAASQQAASSLSSATGEIAPPRVASADRADDLLSVCRRSASPTEFLLCASVGIAPAGAPAADQKLPFWVSAPHDVAEASAVSSPGAGVSAPARTGNAAARARFESGIARLGTSDFDRAVRDFSEAVRADPKFADAYLLRGQIRFRTGDTDGAIADFTKTIEIDPRHAAAYKARGMAVLYKGDDDAAIADLTRAIQYATLDRSRTPPIEVFYARRSRAVIYDHKHLYDSELADLNVMIDGYWKNATLVKALRATYREQGSVSLMASIYRMRAGVHVKRGNPDGAISDLTFAMQLDPKRTLLLTLERAHIQEAAGRRAQAAADFARALHLSPDNEDAQAGMVRLKSRT